MNMFHNYLNLDGTPLRDRLLGVGGAGVVVQRGETAVKLPRRRKGDSHQQTARNCRFIAHEKQVYRRLQNCDGVVRCLSLSIPGAIQMEVMKKGNLFNYLRHCRMTHCYPSQSVQLSWFRQLARALVGIHDRHVLVVSFFTRNLLLSADLTIKFSDFGRSIILPPDADMRTAEKYGYSVSMEIGQLGMVLYQVITGGEHRDFGFVFADNHPGPEDPVWPSRAALPETNDLWLGPLIDRCWTQGAFEDARSLLAELESASVDDEVEATTDHGAKSQDDGHPDESPKTGDGSET
ncbi:hypothetical protein VTN77DRAFT_3499 [Rasamsonia byssochlamydoides]|uniref:uncharacterized protein n=1 Tax=Rasamsonia byssochlamydoides TaxID=89139 RepID=UPI003741F88A